MVAQDYQLCSDEAIDLVAQTLDLIKQGVPWPEDHLHARTSYNLKQGTEPDKALNYRGLTLFCTLYRRWGTWEMKHITPWVMTWQLQQQYSAVVGRGAEDAWTTYAALQEFVQAHNIKYVTGLIDMSKFHDRVLSPLVYALATLIGFPHKLLLMYAKCMEGMCYYNTMGRYLGEQYEKTVALAQGCPFATLMAPLLLKPWILSILDKMLPL